MTQQLLTPKVAEQFTFCMRSPYGQDIWCNAIYREIVYFGEGERPFRLNPNTDFG